jgi:hypothetical protein
MSEIHKVATSCQLVGFVLPNKLAACSYDQAEYFVKSMIADSSHFLLKNWAIQALIIAHIRGLKFLISDL